MTKKKTDNSEKASAGFNPVPWIAGALLVMGLAVLAGFYWEQNMTIREVRFEGNYFVSTQQLQQQVEVPTGIKPDSLDFMKIIHQVERIPYVQKTDLQVEPGGELLVSITERRPAALLMSDKVKYYVDLEGVVLPKITGKPVDVPLLYGFNAEGTDTLKGEAFYAVRDFLAAMNKKPVSNATISEIAWTSDNGVVALTHENGVKLVFGKTEFKRRLRNWEAFYGEVIKSKGIASMRSIDLRYRNQIVTRES